MYSKDHVSKIKNNDVKDTCSDFCHSNYFIEQAKRSPLSSKNFQLTLSTEVATKCVLSDFH